MRAESAVEPTKSENITVTWRRSARSSGGALGALDVVAASTEGALPLASLRRAAMASSSFTRCPSDATPSSFRFSCVRLGRTVSSISFSRNAASYFPRPRLRSQTTMSMTAPHNQGCCTSSCGPGEVSRRSRSKQPGHWRSGFNRCHHKRRHPFRCQSVSGTIKTVPKSVFITKQGGDKRMLCLGGTEMQLI